MPGQELDLNLVYAVCSLKNFILWWWGTLRRQSSLSVEICIDIENTIQPLPHSICLILFETQKYFGGIFRINLYFRIRYIILNLQHFIGNFFHKLKGCICKEEINIPELSFVNNLNLRAKWLRIHGSFNELFDCGIKPDGTDCYLGLPSAYNIIALKMNLNVLLFSPECSNLDPRAHIDMHFQ